METVLHTGLLDFILLVLGFVVGQVTRFKTPVLFIMFMVRLVKWWFETHPQGKRVARETNFDEELATIEKNLAHVDTKDF